MKKNLLTITMLVLCLVISITLMAVPASAQIEFHCDGTEKVTLVDAPDFEFTMNCEGDRLWGLVILDIDFTDLGEIDIEYVICNLYEDDPDAACDAIGEFTDHFSYELLRKEAKYETLDGDKLEIQFKFKP